jgi:hypothetical protein
MLLAFTLAAMAAASVSAEHPDLTGTWKLNVTKSDFNRLSGLISKALKIEHSEPKLKVSSAVVDQLGEHGESYTFTIDGKTNTNTMNGFATETSSIWDGDEIIFDVNRGPNWGYKERWSLSSDGKTLTIKRHTILTRGETNEAFVFDKR